MSARTVDDLTSFLERRAFDSAQQQDVGEAALLREGLDHLLGKYNVSAAES